MGCASCSSDGGTPKGCKNNGTCSSGGCNKLEVYDWLANIALPVGQQRYDLVEVRFKNSRKNFYKNASNLSLQVGDIVVVDTAPGYDIGLVSVVGELARIQVKKKAPNLKANEIKRILKIANQEEIDKWIKGRSLEKDLMYKARTMALKLNLEMKISDVEYQGDLSKSTFYYTAEGRVDFRQLIKDMADEFKVRIEMRQIGSRQESARLGGIGSCGRELCCTTWLTDFRSVSTSAARYQQLSLNPQKLAGQCGKLKCCLNYELDMYLDAIKSFPKTETKLQTEKGDAYYIKTDVFKRVMWYAYQGENGLIALSPERVKEINRMNKAGEKPKELIEFVLSEKVIEIGYSNVVGQDSVNRFEKNFEKKKNNNNRKKKKKSNPIAEGATVAVVNPNANPNQNAKPNPNQNPNAKVNPNQNPNQKPKGNPNPNQKPPQNNSTTNN